MDKIPVKPFLIIILCTICLVHLSGYDERGKSFTFIGSKVCRECHGIDDIGNQYKIWEKSPHSKAWVNLTAEKGIEVAKKHGITSPERDYRCLKCHATGKGVNSAIIREGVGCEACHGPGSEYHKASIHVDYNSRDNGYRRAIAAGMYPILGIKSLKTREKLCLSCHRKDRPCLPENPPENYDDRIPLQVIDSLWKGDVNFKHPLRR
jgi:hypothetical protein